MINKPGNYLKIIFIYSFFSLIIIFMLHLSVELNKPDLRTFGSTELLNITTMHQSEYIFSSFKVAKPILQH